MPLLTCLLLGHPEGVPLEGDAPAAALGRGGVDAQEERRVGREAARQQPARMPRSDVHQQLVLGVREHLEGEDKSCLYMYLGASIYYVHIFL